MGLPGSETAQHLAAAIFDDLTGTLVIHVPYCSNEPPFVGPLAGETALVWAFICAVEMLIHESKVRVPANITATRVRA